MPVNDPCFIPFDDAIAFSNTLAQHGLPEFFTFPFYYQPHPLTILAAQQLQQELLEANPWQHNFGLNSSTDRGMVIGKMFGVLVVKDTQGQLGFLAAFSGKLAEQNILPPFVPPVFDMLTQDSFFSVENKQINQINQLLHQHESDPLMASLSAQLTQQQQQAERELEQQRNAIVAGRKQRKQQREQADNALAQADISSDEHKTLSIELSRQSVQQKHQLNTLKQQWQSQIMATQTQLNELQQQIKQLKRQRKQLSNSLQKKLFAQYQFLNTLGDARDLNDIFNDAPNHLPPAGAGECAAPKLLQYAFKKQLTPVAMAEFWWGASPKSDIKQHKNFYPACHGKCRPILTHMLKGMQVDDDPLLMNPGKDLTIDIIYQDDVMAVINKPAELLSVPGKNITDSVFSRMQQRFPNATGPLIVHRLDMSTSGLMVIALTKEANKTLQQQFIQRSVTKRYIALIEGVPSQNEGEISLPLRVDLDDRPKQLVCYEHGKHAETFWQVHQRLNQRTLVHLYPKTGRTHQLRVHCAHNDGLHMPIVGDDLYGVAANRLHLHAQYLALTHPATGEAMVFEVKADFE
ncbi:pseudouridine synthase [Shewanella sp.]|uniref:pseudouridine synthase n=1 Tax=Shewanella sp. TaxID=50422 RepID=UPI0040489C84